MKAVVHLGTMGVYGYGTAGMKIPEGYFHVKVPTDDGALVDQEILYPTNPGSIYHLTKTQDQLIFAYFNKNDRVRITDLHQGIVWGTQTEQTKLDERLINRFDYDGDYGDRLEPEGHIKGLANLKKMLKAGGYLYLSVPIGRQKVEFNSHRIFSMTWLLEVLKSDFELIEFSYVDDQGELHENVRLEPEVIASNCGCEFGAGMFMLKKK